MILYIPTVEWQESKFTQERHRAVLHAAEEVGQVAVVVVVDLQTAFSDWVVDRDCSAAAKDVNKAVILGGKQLVEKPEELTFFSYPRDEAFHSTSPPKASREASNPEIAY